MHEKVTTVRRGDKVYKYRSLREHDMPGSIAPARGQCIPNGTKVTHESCVCMRHDEDRRNS